MEASSTTTAAAISSGLLAGLAQAAMGMNTYLLAMSFVGSLMFMVIDNHRGLFMKLVYLFASWSFGYSFAEAMIREGLTKTGGLYALFSSALCVVVLTAVVTWVRSGAFTDVVTRAASRFLGGRNDDR